MTKNKKRILRALIFSHKNQKNFIHMHHYIAIIFEREFLKH